eukprot:3482107-Prymnesium_polylepis.2
MRGTPRAHVTTGRGRARTCGASRGPTCACSGPITCSSSRSVCVRLRVWRGAGQPHEPARVRREAGSGAPPAFVDVYTCGVVRALCRARAAACLHVKLRE